MISPAGFFANLTPVSLCFRAAGGYSDPGVPVDGRPRNAGILVIRMVLPRRIFGFALHRIESDLPEGTEIRVPVGLFRPQR